MPYVKPLKKRKQRDLIIQQLETLRQDAGFSKDTLATMMGISRETLRQRYASNGNDFTLSELTRAAKVLNTQISIKFVEEGQ